MFSSLEQNDFEYVGEGSIFNDSISTKPSVVLQSQTPDKYLTAPYFERKPIFSEPEASEQVNTGPKRLNSAKHVPKRPNSSRPSSRGVISASPKQIKQQLSNSLESRILLKIASFMPDDAADSRENNMYNRLSASRTDLIQLNTILDEMTTEIRENENIQGPVLFNNSNHEFDIPESTMNHLDNLTFRNGEIMYDTIMSDLIVQAIKKINRVRKFYKNRFKAIEDANKLKFHALLIEVEELKSALHRVETEKLLYRKAAEDIRNLTAQKQSPNNHFNQHNNSSHQQHSVSPPSLQQDHDNNHIILDNEHNTDAVVTSDKVAEEITDAYTTLATSAMGMQQDTDPHLETSKQAQMAKTLAKILQTERKESLEKLSHISTELMGAQDDLVLANKTIAELKNQLLDRDRQLLELSKRTVQLAVAQMDNTVTSSTKEGKISDDNENNSSSAMNV